MPFALDETGLNMTKLFIRPSSPPLITTFSSVWCPIINRAVMEAIQLRSMETVLEEITLQDHALLMEFMKARDAAGAKQAMAIHLHRAINHLHLQAEMELPPFSAC